VGRKNGAAMICNDWFVRSHRARAARQDSAIRWQPPEKISDATCFALTPAGQALLDEMDRERSAFTAQGRVRL
jgi:hypothetical protein